MKKILLLSLLPLIAACSHSISFKGTHFNTPVVSQKKWGGDLSLSVFDKAQVQIIDDVYSSNPNGTPIPGQENPQLGDFLGINNIGVNAEISPFAQVSVYLDNSILGVKWQFLKPESEEGWVAAVHGGFASTNEDSESYSNSTMTSSLTSKISRQIFALSTGYQFKAFVPYLAFSRENAQIKTSLTNTHGSWNFDNNGTHTYYSIGVQNTVDWPLKNFLVGVEYSHLEMEWGNKTHTQRNAGIRAGIIW